MADANPVKVKPKSKPRPRTQAQTPTAAPEPESPAKSKDKDKGKALPAAAICVRERSNWSRLVDEHRFDNAAFNPSRVATDMPISSPKMQAMIDNIIALDAKDRAEHGHPFKHFIYSDVRSGFGAKIIASGLAAFGFRHCYGIGQTARGKSFVMKPPVADSFATLTTVAFFQKPLGINFRKEVLQCFNARPDNIHGQNLRIVILDSGLREGVDLFDVKYVHLFEPIITPNDEKQAIGRATRFCGQKGLEFDNGWPLQVFRYDTGYLYDLFLEVSNIDTSAMALAQILDDQVIRCAVDHQLTAAFRTPTPTQSGGVIPENNYDRRRMEAATRMADARKAAADQARVPFQKARDAAVAKMRLAEATARLVWEAKESIRLKVEADIAATRAAEEAALAAEEAKRQAAEETRRQAADKALQIAKVAAEQAYLIEYAKKRALEEDERRRKAAAQAAMIERYEEERRQKAAALEAERRAREAAALLEAAEALKRENEAREAARLRAAEETEVARLALIQAAWAVRQAKFNRPRAPPPPPNTTVEDLELYIQRWYGDFAWPPLKNENGCIIPPPPSPSPLQAQATATTPTVDFSPTQDFLRHYLNPTSPHRGLLAYHSVGTGKTCLAISVATTSFEPAGWTIIYVTKTTLKGDVWKNMFDQSCSLILQERMLDGLQIPTDKAARTRLLSRAWSAIQPLSYRQFSNMLRGKNELAKKLKQINGAKDPLRKTLVIIDEAHKLFVSDMPPSEKSDIGAIRRSIENSVATANAAGTPNDAVRLLLMTGTPYTDDPMDMVKLLNLLIDKPNQMPDTFAAFASKFLAPADAQAQAPPTFTEQGRQEFRNLIAGKISYLNRSQDKRTFAYPIIKDINVPLAPLEYQDARRQYLKASTKAILADADLEDMRKEKEQGQGPEAAAAATALLKFKENALKDCLDSTAAVKECKATAKARGAALLEAAKARGEKGAQLTVIRKATSDAEELCATLKRDCAPLKADIQSYKTSETARLKNERAARTSKIAAAEENVKILKKAAQELKTIMQEQMKTDRSQKRAIDECTAASASATTASTATKPT